MTENQFKSMNQFFSDNLLLYQTILFFTCIYASSVNFMEYAESVFSDKKINSQNILKYVNDYTIKPPQYLLF
jgi:hypothetical protein